MNHSIWFSILIVIFVHDLGITVNWCVLSVFPAFEASLCILKKGI